MLKYSEKFKKNLITLIISFIGPLIISVIYFHTTFFDNSENRIYDFMFGIKRFGIIKSNGNISVRKNEFIHPDIVIIGIETDDLQKIGKWPWSRKIHVQLIKTLIPYKPKLIYFDMFFSESDTEHPENDQALKEAVEQAGNVYFNYYFLTDSIGSKENNVNSKFLFDKFSFESLSKVREKYKDILPGVTEIYEKSKGIGFINNEPESDGITRNIPLVIYYQKRIYPSIALLLACDYMGITKDKIKIKFGNKIELDNSDIPIDSDGKMLINYIGSKKSFQYFSYNEILNRKIEFDWENKVILVGFTSTLGLLDIKITPFGPIPGVEIIANVINQILRKDYLNSLSTMQNIYIIFVIGICIGIISISIRHFKWLFISSAIVVSYILFVFWQFDNNNKLMSITPNISAIILNFILIAIYHYILKEKEEKKVRAIFSSYVTPILAEEILKNPEKAGIHGETREMTVLFSDIRNFTVFSEKRKPHEIVEMLNEYLSAMTYVVLKYNGILDKYVGDEIMAFWGAPIFQPDHAELAVKCGIEMLKVLKDLKNKWLSEGKAPIGIGIGINSGEMIVGNIGTPGKKMDFTVIGDNVNLGARVEALTRKYNYDIIITEFTYKYIKNSIDAKELDTVIVKGKTLPVKIYGIS